MSDFLDTLVARSADSTLPEGPSPESPVAPRLLSRFEPQREPAFGSAGDAWSDETFAPADGVSQSDLAQAAEPRTIEPASRATELSIRPETDQPRQNREHSREAQPTTRIRDGLAPPAAAALQASGKLEVPTIESGLKERVAALARDLRAMQVAERGNEHSQAAQALSSPVAEFDRRAHAESAPGAPSQRRPVASPLVVPTPREARPQPLPRLQPQSEQLSPPAKRPGPPAASPIARESAPVAPPRIVPEELPSRAAPALPTVNVTIGRVEVKAVREAAPPAPRSERTKSNVMSLEQYLERRAAGGRS